MIHNNIYTSKDGIYITGSFNPITNEFIKFNDGKTTSFLIQHYIFHFILKKEL